MDDNASISDSAKVCSGGLPAPWVAQLESHRARVRHHVQRHMDGMRTPYWQHDGRGYVERMADPEDADVHALIETAAQAAALPATELVGIVADLAPRASARRSHRTLISLAEIALEDFQRPPTRRRPTRRRIRSIAA